MASVSGASDDALQTALDKAAGIVGGGAKAYIANYMFPEGRTCSGDKAVLEKMCELVVEMGAKNAKMVNVSGAFHTPYMAAASEALGKTLDEAEIKMPSILVYSNVTGKPYTSVDEIKLPPQAPAARARQVGAGHQGPRHARLHPVRRGGPRQAAQGDDAPHRQRRVGQVHHPRPDVSARQRGARARRPPPHVGVTTPSKFRTAA